MSDGLPCMWMRGGTSKGAYFLADDMPGNTAERDAFLLSIMGSPDPRQIDGMGGADPLTSKVAIVKKSEREGVDVDYLFVQVAVEEPLVTDAQNCGNMLAGVGPFAVERGLVVPEEEVTPVVIFMENTGQTATALVRTPHGRVTYEGDARIDGVPGTSSPVEIAFEDTAGASCGALLPTGYVKDRIEGVEVTLLDNGMPGVIMRADEMGIVGTESREQLDGDSALKAKLEAIRIKAGHLMNLGDVTEKTIPKMTMVSAPANGGTISTRTFIPHRCHSSIGVLGAVSVATACLIKGSVAADLARIPGGNPKSISVEHPIGETTIIVRLDEAGEVASAGVLRTARKLFDGTVFSRRRGEDDG
ncbi:MAG TPA: 4-oxalomesaconate tautomerase [Devosia sp.]|nr:4-oxalomesaconate tautomerase [Devosia sp.]